MIKSGLIISLAVLTMLATAFSGSLAASDVRGAAIVMKDTSLYFMPASTKIGFLKQSSIVVVEKHDSLWSQIVVDGWIKKSVVNPQPGDQIFYTKRKRTRIYKTPGEDSLIGSFKQGIELVIFLEIKEDSQHSQWIRIIGNGWVPTKLLKKYQEPPIEFPEELPPEPELSDTAPLAE